jgi:hypothetical protein
VHNDRLIDALMTQAFSAQQCAELGSGSRSFRMSGSFTCIR